jgi:hypothetical protein
MIISCQNLKFDAKLSLQRINTATHIFGVAVIRRILCFSLYLLGITRSSIAKVVEMPTNSVKTIIKNINHNGIPAFEDRRFSNSTFLPRVQEVLPLEVNLTFEEKWINIDLGKESKKLRLPASNTLQFRTLLLTMLNSGLLSTSQTAEYLELSTVQTRDLAKKMQEKDVGSLLDQKQK